MRVLDYEGELEYRHLAETAWVGEYLDILIASQASLRRIERP